MTLLSRRWLSRRWLSGRWLGVGPVAGCLVSVILGLALVATDGHRASLAQEPGAVVATVNGLEITERELSQTMERFADQLAGAPEAAARGASLRHLIELKIIVASALEAGVEDTEAFRSRLAFMREQALREAYLSQEITGKISEADIDAVYQRRIADFEAQPEVSARHILVETEDKGRELIAELDGGADFAQLAREHSTGPSGPQGGDLGFFGRGQMVPTFDAAVFALEAGAHSAEPVQTQFGWHVIKVEERRETSPPTVGVLRDEIVNQLVRERYQAHLVNLNADAEIVYIDESLKP